MNGQIVTIDPEIQGGVPVFAGTQNLAALPIAVVILAVLRNRIQEIRPLVPELLETRVRTQPGSLMKIGR